MRFVQAFQMVLLSLLIIKSNQALGEVKSPLSPLKTVAVFCGADDKVGDNVKELARNIGQGLARHGYGLITGGSKTGLMLEVNDGFISQGT